MVVASKFYNDLTARRAPSKTNGAHGCFGPRTHHSDFFNTRNRVDYLLGKAALGLRWSTVARTTRECIFNGRNNPWMTVTKNHWAPRADVIKVGMAMDIRKMRPLPCLKKNRFATHSPECSRRRIHSTWNKSLSASEGLVAEPTNVSHSCCPWVIDFSVLAVSMVFRRSFVAATMSAV